MFVVPPSGGEFGDGPPECGTTNYNLFIAYFHTVVEKC
jgi:hypothetical protein